MDKAVPIAIQAVTDFAKNNPATTLTKITFALWPNTFPVYRDKLVGATFKKPETGPNALLLPFYRGIGIDSEGRTLEQILQFSDSEKEAKHDFIQWLFPSKTPSQFNSKAPVLNDALIAEMRSAITESDAVAHEAGAMTYASRPSEDEWAITQSWHNARKKCGR